MYTDDAYTHTKLTPTVQLQENLNTPYEEYQTLDRVEGKITSHNENFKGEGTQ